MKLYFFIPLIIVLTISCEESQGIEKNSGVSHSEFANEINYSGGKGNRHQELVSNEVVLHGITYDAQLITALDFIQRRGEKPHQSDIKGLKQESVLILEITTNEEVKDIYASKKLKLSQDDAVQYLTMEIASDLTVHQEKKEFSPNGVQFDGALTGANKFRVFFFFNGLDLNKEITIKYYDRLFDAGLINIKHTELNQ